MAHLKWGSLQTLALVYSVLSLCQAFLDHGPSWVLGRACLMLPVILAAQWFLFRWANMLFPRQTQGSLVALALLFLSPSLLGWPQHEFKEGLSLALAAILCWVSFKIWLRDGIKPPSMVLLFTLVAGGCLLTARFLFLLPWVLVPLGLAARGWRKSLLWISLLLLVGTAVGFWGRHLDPDSFLWSQGQSRWLFWGDSINASPSGWPWLFYWGWLASLLGILVLAFLPAPPGYWRLTPWIRVLGICSCLMMAASFLPFSKEMEIARFPLVWWISFPGLFILIASGATQLADWFRKTRSIPNLIAQQPVTLVYLFFFLLLLTRF